MTISDLVKRLTTLQKEIGATAQIKLGKAYNSCDSVFDFFEIKVVGVGKERNIVFTPSDSWDKDLEKRRK